MATSVVLVVEDEPDMRMLMCLMLEHEGFEVRQASTGEEAVTELDRGGIDLMLLDLHLPGLDGFQILNIMQGKGDGQPPVLVATADADPALEGKVKDLGAKGFLSKSDIADALIPQVTGLLLDGSG